MSAFSGMGSFSGFSGRNSTAEVEAEESAEAGTRFDPDVISNVISDVVPTTYRA